MSARIGADVAVAAPRGGVEQALRKAALVMGFALLTALGAQVRIPLTPVPITLQTFFVLLGGLMLGPRLGVSAQALYVALGAVGAPVFAGGALGFAYLLGPTGGYLVGFVAAAWLVGQLARGLDPKSPRAVWQVLGILAAGSIAIYVPGAYWLARVMGMGWWAALAKGVIRFLPGDALKVALAASLWLRVGRSRQLHSIAGEGCADD